MCDTTACITPRATWWFALIAPRRMGPWAHRSLLCWRCVVQEEGAAPAEGGGLDSEVLEEIFRQVSEECQAEMQDAMENDADVSDACKAEIRGAIDNTEQARAAKQATEEAPAQSSSFISPTIIILIVVIAAVGGLVHYVIEENKRNPVKLKTSRSKKKEERDRRRGR